ncbi:DUF7010 family protein [Herpetosiphon sp. NSE202]|uniref:DUF7010 family protein n=1 Tax=Herpetosiphon sp. NSE202 TaxID=3351349 RepID=UPI00362C3D5C
MDWSISAAQADMREGYYSGATGILASALAWSVAAGVALAGSPNRAIVVLLLGGMLIFPVSIVICKILGVRGTHTKGNPLGQLAGASTFWLIFCLPLAYGLGQENLAWFFSAMLIVIGGRYLIFATLYGMRLYWILGLALAAAAIGLVFLSAAATIAVSAGALIELGFAITCFVYHRQSLRSLASGKLSS